MQACQWESQQVNRSIDSLGIVYEAPLYAIGNLEVVLGWLKYIFQLCQANLD